MPTCCRPGASPCKARRRTSRTTSRFAKSISASAHARPVQGCTSGSRQWRGRKAWLCDHRRRLLSRRSRARANPTTCSSIIRSGRFPIESRLPAERELTTIFNTSRQTIREAIYRAELAGLIEVRHGAGSFVVSRGSRMPEKNVGELIGIEEEKVGEFFEIRRTLEGWCASKAAKAGSKSQFAALKARLDAMRVLDVKSDAWEENDIGFHRALAAATGNPLAVRMMEIMREASRRSIGSSATPPIGSSTD